MRTDSYDAYDAYDADDSYEAYTERRWAPNVRRKPANYTGGVGAASRPTEFVTRSELQLALAPVSRDIAAQGEAVTTLGKRVEAALVKIDKDTTAARRDVLAARRGIQSSQMMALLPLLLTNNTPPTLAEARTGLHIKFRKADGTLVTFPPIDGRISADSIQGITPVIVDDGDKEVKVVTDVQYSALSQNNSSNSLLTLVLLMSMMGGGFGGESKESGGGDNNMMMMLLLVMMMGRPQTTTAPPSTVVVAN